MITFSDDVVGLARELLGSMWAELGLEGAPRRHDWLAIDLEPLIIFTAFAGDSRLRDRSIAWCTINSRHLSASRLNRFSRMLGQAGGDAYKRYAAALQKRSGRVRLSVTPDLRRPSLIQLRLRALLGATPRAEALRLLLAEPEQTKSAAAMAGPAGYGKASMAQALEMLTLSGIATATTEGKQRVYRLNRPADLAQALSGLPARFPDWHSTFRVIGAILEYAAESARNAGARTQIAAHAMHRVASDVARVQDAASPPALTDDEASIAAFERWARSFVAGQAGAHSSRSNKREVTYTVHRLLLGGWIATVREEGDQPRPLALSDDPELHLDRRSKRRLNLDEIGAAAQVIESMFYDLRSRELQRRRGSLVPRDAVADALLPAISREFAAELLRPMHKGQAATFTDEFLERWSANRRSGFNAAG